MDREHGARVSGGTMRFRGIGWLVMITALLALWPGSARAFFYGGIFDAGTFGSTGAGPGQLDDPLGICAGPDGRIYVTDRGNSRVQMFDRFGSFLGSIGRAGSGDAEFDEIGFIAGSASLGLLAVADAGNGRIQLFDFDGRFLGKFPVVGSPRGVAFGLDGNLYVTTADRVVAYRTSGGFLGEFGVGELSSPGAITARQRGEGFVVADTGNDRIAVFGSDGALTPGYGTLIRRFEFKAPRLRKRAVPLASGLGGNFRIRVRLPKAKEKREHFGVKFRAIDGLGQTSDFQGRPVSSRVIRSSR